MSAGCPFLCLQRSVMLSVFLVLILLYCHCTFALRSKHILLGPQIFSVRGIRHYPQGYIRSLVGKQVQIERENNNVYDTNAIKVENQEGHCCGYIARSDAALFSPILDTILSFSELSATPVEVECDLIRCDRFECDLQVTICCPANSRLPRLFHTWKTKSDIESLKLLKETLFLKKRYLDNEQYDYFGNFELGSGNGV